MPQTPSTPSSPKTTPQNPSSSIHIPPVIQAMKDEDLLHPFKPLNHLFLQFNDEKYDRVFVMSSELEFDAEGLAVGWIIAVYEDKEGEVKAWEGGVDLLTWDTPKDEIAVSVLNLRDAWKSRKLDIAYTRKGDVNKMRFHLPSGDMFQIDDFMACQGDNASDLHALTLKLLGRLEKDEEEKGALDSSRLSTIEGTMDAVLLRLDNMKKRYQTLKRRRSSANGSDDVSPGKRSKSDLEGKSSTEGKEKGDKA